MTALVLFVLANPTWLAVMAGILGALGWGFSQRLTGARLEREKHAAVEAEARDIADQVDNDIGALSPEKARAALKKW